MDNVKPLSAPQNATISQLGMEVSVCLRKETHLLLATLGLRPRQHKPLSLSDATTLRVGSIESVLILFKIIQGIANLYTHCTCQITYQIITMNGPHHHHGVQ